MVYVQMADKLRDNVTRDAFDALLGGLLLSSSWSAEANHVISAFPRSSHCKL
jgi:hypothetical protein